MTTTQHAAPRAAAPAERTATERTATERKANQRPVAERTATPMIAPAGGQAIHQEAGQARATRYVLAGLRIGLGFIFLWAFLDKLFGLGHETTSAQAWVNGGSPTKGFLGKGVSGPFESVYHGIAGAGWADFLFMLALAAVGTALILGIGLRIAAVAGGALLVLMWTAVLPPENNLFMDDHLIYVGVLAVLALTAAGATLGLGRQWARLPIVERLPWLK